MRKKIPLKTKPTAPKPPEMTPEEKEAWVSKGSNQVLPSSEETSTKSTRVKVPTKRFTIDVPIDLHTRIKSQCASRGVKMNEEILVLLEKHFPV